ncbi:MAG: hypothetical protein GX640_23195 [Fibrobacter sp.]|nr:hypothetical protein [Fibrobacter sp.]
MYEKPQYLTPDGYRRSSNNPYRDGSLNSEIQKLILKKTILKNATPQPSSTEPPQTNRYGSVHPIVQQYLDQKFKRPAKPQISDKAAKLIAMTIKGLLNSK